MRTEARLTALATSRPDAIVAILLGALAAAVLIASSALGAKPAAIVLCGLAAAACWPLAISFPALAEKMLLFALTFTMSISLKVHPIFRSEHLGGAIGLRIAVTDVLLVLLVGTWLASRGAGRRLRIHVDTPILVALATYLAFAALSIPFGPDPALGLFQLVAYVQAFVTFVIVANYVTDLRRLRIALAGLLLGLTLQSGVTLVQARDPGRLSLAFLGSGEVEETETAGVVALPGVDRGTTTLAGEVRRRPMGLLIHPNVLGTYFILAIPVAAALALSAGPAWMQALAWGALALAMPALYHSLSRSGWAGVALAGALAALLAWRWRAIHLGPFRRALLAVAAIGLLGALAVAAPTIRSRLTETYREAVSFRMDLARTAWNMIEARPFTGIGLNTFVTVMPEYDETGMSRLRTYPVHNLYLLEASETGVLGGIAFLALVATVLVRGFMAARRSPVALRLVGIALAAGLAGVWFSETSGFVYRIPVMTTIVWVHLGLLAAMARLDATERP